MRLRNLAVAHRRRRATAVCVTVACLVLGAAPSGPAPARAQEVVSAFPVFGALAESAPLRPGVGIPLEQFVKVAGSEAQASQGPIGRGAGMLVDTRITQLASLLVFGTVPIPALALPIPTVAETVWSGEPEPTRAVASLVPEVGSPGILTLGAGQATAEASAGPIGRGRAAFGESSIEVAGVADLISIGSMESSSFADGSGREGSVFSRTEAHVGQISILGGLIKIDGITTAASASANGKSGGAEAKAELTLGRVTVLGNRAEINFDGIEVTDSSLPLPVRQVLNALLLESLQSAGITIRALPPKITEAEDGTAAVAEVQGVYVRVGAESLMELNPLVGGLSLNFVFGWAHADASASDPFASAAPDDGSTGSPAGPSVDLGISPPIDAGPLSTPSDSFGSDAPITPAPTTDVASFPTADSPSRGVASRSPVSIADWWPVGLGLLLAGLALSAGLVAVPNLIRPSRRYIPMV